MEVIFLGTGNAFYSEQSDMSSVLICDKNEDILVDCGPGCLKNYLRFAGNPHQLKYILFTHFHGDHIAGLPFLLLYLYHFYRDKSLPIIIGPKGIKKRVRKLSEACYQGFTLTKGIVFQELGKKQIGQRLPMGKAWEFRIYPMVHKKESLGYRISRDNVSVAITGDTGWNDNITTMAEGCDLLITECSSLTPEISIHLSATELLEQIGQINAKLIIPVHRGEAVQEKLEENQARSIKIVQDGDRITLN